MPMMMWIDPQTLKERGRHSLENKDNKHHHCIICLLSRFRAKIENKTQVQVLDLFRKECIPKVEQLKQKRGSLYPIALDFP